MRHCCGKHSYILKAATETEVEARTLGERPSIDKFKRDILVKVIKRGKVCGSFCSHSELCKERNFGDQW
jgi:hypothetical protein